MMRILSIRQREEDTEHEAAKVKNEPRQKIVHDCFDCGQTFQNKPALKAHVVARAEMLQGV